MKSINVLGLHPVIRKAAGKIGRTLIAPAAIPFYKRAPGLCPDSILYSLYINNTAYSPAFYTLQRILESIEKFEGEIVECGVYKGNSLLGMAHILKKKKLDVKIYGLDSFEGFPEPGQQDTVDGKEFHQMTRKGVFGDTSEKIVAQRIERLGFENQITLIKGFFKDTLSQLKNHKISVLHLDVDLYDSYKICLEHLYEAVVPGGYIIFDEYSNCKTAYPGAETAINEFFLNKPETINFFMDATSNNQQRAFVKKLENSHN